MDGNGRVVQRAVADGRFDARSRDLFELDEAAPRLSKRRFTDGQLAIERTRRPRDPRPMPLDFVNAKEKKKKHVRLP